MKDLLTLPTRRPLATLVIGLILVLLSVIAIARLRAETSLDAMLDPTNPATAAMTNVLKRLPVAEELLVLVSTPEGRPVEREALARFADRLSDALRRDATDVVTAVRFRPSNQAKIFVEKIVAPAGLLYLSDAQVDEARTRLTAAAMLEQFKRNEALLAAPGPAAGGLAKAILRDPLRLYELLQDRLRELVPSNLAQDGFYSPDGRSLLIRVAGAKPLSDLPFSTKLTELVTAACDRANTDALELQLTGGYAIAAYNARMIRGDAIQDSVSSVFVLAAVFTLLYRKPLSTFTVAFIPIAAGIVWGFGVYALLRSTITPLAAVIGGALGGIGIDYSTHMLSHFHDGASPAELVRRMAWPLLAACVTSVLGFAVIGYSPVRLLQDFALVGSLALAGAFVAALTILPALLTVRRAVARPRTQVMRAPWRRPSRVLLISLLALMPFALIAAGVDLRRQDPDVHNLHPQPNPPLDAQDVVARRMGLGGGEFLVYVTGNSAEELLQRCCAVQAALTRGARSAGVKTVFGPGSLLPPPDAARRRRALFSAQDVEGVLAAFDAAVASSGFSADAYAGYRAALPALLKPAHVPDVLDLAQYPDISGDILPTDPAENVAVVHIFMDHPVETREQIRRAIDELSSLLKDVPGATLTGMAVIGQQTLVAVQRDLPRVALLAGVCVAGYLVLHYRSFTLAFLALIPTIVSLILLLAVMRVAGITLNVVNLVMVPLLLGINIDFGIFAADTLRAPEEGTLDEQFTSSLKAMTTCTATAVVGFGSLVFTSVPAVRSLGVLVMVGVVGCAVGAAAVLWPVVLLIAKRRGIR